MECHDQDGEVKKERKKDSIKDAAVSDHAGAKLFQH